METSKVTNELIEGAVKCDHKITHLLNRSATEEKEYLRVQKIIKDLHRDRCLRILAKSGRLLDGLSTRNIHGANIGRETIYAIGFTIITETIDIVFDAVAIERFGRSAFSIEPIFFSSKRRLDAEERHLITVRSLLAQEASGFRLKKAIVFLLNESEPTSIRVSTRNADIRLIQKLKAIIAGQVPETHARIISHCKECVFEGLCQQELKARDDLSLLSGMSGNEIKAHQAKGVFTINQLSHTYRPRRRPDGSKPKFYPSLKAMAIREAKVYVTQPLIVPSEKVDVFIDVEGIPEIDFYYLIGVHVRTIRTTKTFSLWAKDLTEERKIWIELLALLKSLQNYAVFHYGNYERIFFKKMRKRYRLTTDEDEVFNSARARLVNVVSLIYGRIYFPTYSNGLKDIGKFLGVEWSKDASGVLSTAWRGAWELSGDSNFQTKIIKYNSDDCLALSRVVEFVRRLSSSNGQSASIDGKTVENSDDIRWRSTYKWGNTSFLVSEFDQINKCAYFDYQSTKIYFGKRRKRKVQASKKANEQFRFKANKTIAFEPPVDCPRCGGETYKHSAYTKKLVDLKFVNGGVRRWVVKYRGLRRRCRRCRHAYYSKKYRASSQRHGHNLVAFVVYLNIALRLSFGEIREYFRRVFGMDMSPSMLSRMKRSLATYYEPAVRDFLRTIRKGHLIQVDETNARVDGKGCYVWIFASLSEVVYLFSESRKGAILHKQLRKFKGVLISDFFAAYDSVQCEQQKCLIHLIRDLNDDLFKNQLNQEFKVFVQEFAILMKGIVETIDKWGLRARYLSKHKRDVRRYFRKLRRSEFKTEIAQQYQKRFLKNEGRLFTFLNFDNVPWNNNYAENAIKTFAEFRSKFNGYFQKNGLRESLVLLSIQYTCKLRGIDFLQFLLSRRKTLPPPSSQS